MMRKQGDYKTVCYECGCVFNASHVPERNVRYLCLICYNKAKHKTYASVKKSNAMLRDTEKCMWHRAKVAKSVEASEVKWNEP